MGNTWQVWPGRLEANATRALSRLRICHPALHRSRPASPAATDQVARLTSSLSAPRPGELAGRATTATKRLQFRTMRVN